MRLVYHFNDYRDHISYDLTISIELNCGFLHTVYFKTNRITKSSYHSCGMDYLSMIYKLCGDIYENFTT